MARSAKRTTRQPATKFAHLRKKLEGRRVRGQTKRGKT